MLVLHAHWQPMRRPVDNGGILFWAETSDVHLPSIWRNRVQQKSQNRDHPYCLSPENLRLQIGIGTPLGKARNEIAYLRLPTGRSGPIPSPDLGNDWDIDEEQRMHLAPWLVNGLWLPPDKALGVLVSLPEQSPVFVLAEDAKFWRKAADLVLETLSSQKILPTMMQVNEKGGLQWDTTVNGHTISGWQCWMARMTTSAWRSWPRPCRWSAGLRSLTRPKARSPVGLNLPLDCWILSSKPPATR
jgi:hypothetical protein